ncbi:MAG: hypothetical protein ACE5H1_05440 [Thermodesulfobacteriota bacterium]
MINSLSQKLNIQVNGYQIILNQELNETELNAHDFKKIGFFGRRFIKVERNELVFFTKNCEFKYLREEFTNTIFPILDTKAGTAIMYGTSSYLRYKQKVLSKFIFQIIQNKMAAQEHLKDFEQKLLDSIGKPVSSIGSSIIWERENQKLILEFPKNGNGYIHMMIVE